MSAVPGSGRALIVETDGGSRGNPGPAGFGALVRDAVTGEVLAEVAEAIGIATNNVAEYGGLVAGLQAAAAIDPDARVEVRADSRLVVEQMSGRWKIKHEDMRRLALQAHKVLPADRVTYTWVPRAMNTSADRLANEAMDAAARGQTWTRRTIDEGEPMSRGVAMTAQQRAYVPPGGQVLTPYICPRNAAGAIDWYVRVFGATETIERLVDPDGRIGHAEISIDGAAIMVSDAYPDYGAVSPEEGSRTATFALILYVPDADATIAAAQAAGADVQRPVEEQFYGSRAGTVLDPFGVRWRVSTHVRDVPAQELARAAGEYRGAQPGPLA